MIIISPIDIFVNHKNHLKKIFITIGKCYTIYITSEVIFLSDNVLKDMGERIYKRRKTLKLTQEELAEQVGVSTQMISNLELGKKAIRPENLIKISSTLDISCDYILKGTTNKNSSSELTEKIANLNETDLKFVNQMLNYINKK